MVKVDLVVHNAQVYSSGTVFHGGIAIANEKIVDVCADDYLLCLSLQRQVIILQNLLTRTGG